MRNKRKGARHHCAPDYFCTRFVKSEPILKGFSEDQKFCVTDKSGVKYLLRISPMERVEHCQSSFKMLKHVSEMGVPMCVPLEFGTCNGRLYTLHSWVDGKDLAIVLPTLAKSEQYALGLKAGEILKKMHTIPAPKTQEEWGGNL